MKQLFTFFFFIASLYHLPLFAGHLETAATLHLDQTVENSTKHDLYKELIKTSEPTLQSLAKKSYKHFQTSERSSGEKAAFYNVKAAIYLEALYLIDCGIDPVKQFHWQLENLTLEKFEKKLKTNISQKLPRDFVFPEQQIDDRTKRYLISSLHPLKPILDSLFLKERVIQDEKQLLRAGFIPLDVKRSHSGIVVARHKKMNGYLMKAYLDDQLYQKWGLPGHEWLIQRCISAERIRNVIKKHNLKHFQVPQKWLYLLPKYPQCPQNKHYTQHPFVLIVEDMQILSHSASKEAWKNVDKEVLDELFIIIKETKGSSYRPDNIPISKNGKFSFIDTEYLRSKPHYGEIRSYLSKKMRRYWDTLVESSSESSTYHQ